MILNDQLVNNISPSSNLWEIVYSNTESSRIQLQQGWRRTFNVWNMWNCKCHSQHNWSWSGDCNDMECNSEGNSSLPHMLTIASHCDNCHRLWQLRHALTITTQLTITTHLTIATCFDNFLFTIENFLQTKGRLCSEGKLPNENKSGIKNSIWAQQWDLFPLQTPFTTSFPLSPRQKREGWPISQLSPNNHKNLEAKVKSPKPKAKRGGLTHFPIISQQSQECWNILSASSMIGSIIKE